MAGRIGRRGRIWIAALALGLAAAGLAAIWLLRPAGDGADVATAFLRHALAGRTAEAYALTTPGFRSRSDRAALAARLAGRAPLEALRTDSVRTVGNDRTRTTWIEGSVVGADGCEAAVSVEIRNGLVERFSLGPGCRPG